MATSMSISSGSYRSEYDFIRAMGIESLSYNHSKGGFDVIMTHGTTSFISREYYEEAKRSYMGSRYKPTPYTMPPPGPTTTTVTTTPSSAAATAIYGLKGGAMSVSAAFRKYVFGSDEVFGGGAPKKDPITEGLHKAIDDMMASMA